MHAEGGLPAASYTLIRRASVPAASVDVSVVIPNYNTSAFVLAAIRSALQQTYRAIEVIVVDDGSADDSLAQIARVNDERLTCVTQVNRGLAAARNTGIAIARGRYLGFLDSDDIWYPEKLARHVAVMERDQGVGLTFSHSAYLNEDGSPTGDYLISRSSRPDVWQLVKRNHVGNGSTPVLRKECFERAGVFDEDLSGCADWEFWVRVAGRSRLAVKLVPEVLTGYRVRQGSMTVTSTGYDAFLRDGLEAIERFGRSVPGFTPAHAAGARAQLYRITSRKALSNGQIAVSRQFLLQALRHSPSAVLRDVRAILMMAFHGAAMALPRPAQTRLYRFSRTVLRRSVWRREMALTAALDANPAACDRIAS